MDFYKIIIVLFFFIQYLGIGAVSQAVIVLLTINELIRGAKFKFSPINVLFLSLLFIIFYCKGFYMPLLGSLMIFKFYWGFILFYFFFTISNFKVDFSFLFKCLIVVTIVESILINTIVPLSLMKNIPVTHLEVIESESYLTIIQRAYGLASSPTASATVVVTLLACIFKLQPQAYKDSYILMAAFALVLLGSGTGFILMILFLIVRYRLFSGFRMGIGLLAIFLLVGFIAGNDIANGGVLMRLSGSYFEGLRDLKFEQFFEVWNKISRSSVELLFGYGYESLDDLRLLSDFGWIDFLECCGLLGVFLFLAFIILNAKKELLLPIAIVLIGYFHYPSLGSIPGQIVFGAMLAYKKNYTLA